MTTGAMLDARVREFELTIKELEAELNATKGKLHMMETMYVKECKRAHMYYRWTIQASNLMIDIDKAIRDAAEILDKDEQHQTSKEVDLSMEDLEQAITGVNHVKDGNSRRHPPGDAEPDRY